MQFAVDFFDAGRDLRNKVFAFTQSKFSSAYPWKHTGLHQVVNSPVYSGGFYFGFKTFVELHNILVSKGGFAFEMDLQLGDI